MGRAWWFARDTEEGPRAPGGYNLPHWRLKGQGHDGPARGQKITARDPKITGRVRRSPFTFPWDFRGFSTPNISKPPKPSNRLVILAPRFSFTTVEATTIRHTLVVEELPAPEAVRVRLG